MLMNILFTTLLTLLLLAPAALAQEQEEIETYLVAPFTLNRIVTVTMADGTKVQGKMLSGDDDKIVVEQKGAPVELRTNQISTIRFRRFKRNTKVDFAGNLLGGIGFGFGGASIGKLAAESIRGDGTPGRIGPIMGGVVLGFIGGYVGREIARNSSIERVTLKVTQGVEGQPPKVGSITLPAPESNARVQPVNLRR